MLNSKWLSHPKYNGDNIGSLRTFTNGEISVAINNIGTMVTTLGEEKNHSIA